MTEAPLEREAQGTWAKLRRRKVVQWGLLYATGAWGLAQGLAHLVDTYHFPESILQVGTLALAAGLPIAVVLAWYHGDKGEQKVGGTELAILTVLLLAAGGALWWYGSRLEDASPVEAAVTVERTVPKDAPSVAVLPFVNMSSDPEQEYFSDGLSEEILNALARLPGLYVPARTSSFQFKDQGGDVAAFAARLGVATVLEGSVRKAGGRVRITAQLINAANGYHLWSQTYDRELTDIFAIQSEIANAIADALQLRLTAQQKLAAEREPPTRSLDAYEAYLLGRHEINMDTPESVASAIRNLEAAVRMDPQFAEAHANLAVAIVRDKFRTASLKESFSEERQVHLAQAADHVARAMALNPNHAEVLAAAGFLERWKSNRARDENALEYFERSLKANPSSGRVLTWRNRELLRAHRYDLLLSVSEEALKRDPLSSDALEFRIEALLRLGRIMEASGVATVLRALDEARGERWLAELALRQGDRVAAIEHCVASVRAGGDHSCGLYAFAALGLREEVFARTNEPTAHLVLGDIDKGVRLGQQAYERDPDWWDWEMVLFNWYIGDYRASWNAYERVTRSDQQGIGYSIWTGNPQIWLVAADSARHLDRGTEAEALHARASDVAARQVTAAAPFQPDDQLLQLYLAVYERRYDDAVGHLAAGFAAGNSWRSTLAAPFFDEISRRPDFNEVLRNEEAVRRRQRQDVLQLLCSGDPLPERYRPAPETCANFQATD